MIRRSARSLPTSQRFHTTKICSRLDWLVEFGCTKADLSSSDLSGATGFGHIPPKSLERYAAHMVLDTFGVGVSRLGIDTQRNEKLSYDTVAHA